MRNYVLFFGFVLFVAPAFGQNNIKKSAAVTYTQGPPTYTVLLPSSSEIAVDTTTGKIYQYHRTTSTWLQLGQGIDVISGSIPPAYTPLRNQSLFAINAVDSLYHYRSGIWRHLNAAGGITNEVHVIMEGNTPRAHKDSLEFQSNSSIVLASTNTSTRTVIEATIESNAVGSAEIAADAVGNSELAANSVDSTNVINGGLSVLDFGQHGAASGNVLKWNGTQWAPAADNGTLSGNGSAGRIPYYTGTITLGNEAELNYDATNNRIGINKTSPAVTVDIQQANGSDGLRIQSDGTVDQDVWGTEYVGTATGPYTQRGRIGVDIYSNAGALPDGHSMNFVLSRDGGSTYTPLALYNNQALFNRASSFTIANNTAELRFAPASDNQIRMYHTALIAGAAFGILDTTQRLRVVGRTQTSASFSARFYDGNAQLAFSVRDDRRAGFNAATLDAVLNVHGLGATSGTYGLIVTPTGGTTTTGTLVVRDDNRVGIRTNAPQTPLNVVGTGTTSGTTALLVEGSGGQDNLNVRDDGVNIGQGFAMASSAPSIAFASAAGTGPVNDLCSGGANGFVLFFTTGTSPGTNAAIFTATLPKSYPNGVIATWSCGDTDCLDEAPDIYISGTGNNSVTLSTRGTLTASTAYVIYVTCFGY